jgi:uncharacterized protein
MNVLVSGGSGLVGSALIPALSSRGHGVMRLVRPRSKRAGAEVVWDPLGAPDPTAFQGYDAVVHLAGESIVGRWTAEKKSRILNSRVQGTQTLAAALARMSTPPKLLLCASAIGFYGERGDEVLVEESAPGTGFLAEVGRQWEAACEPARVAGIRVVNLRLGVILAAGGGALARMLPPFKLGLGGRLGSGRQWMSWIALEDVIGAIEHILANGALRGSVNAVAPQAVSNAEFTRTLGQVLHRPVIFPMPAFAVRLVFGEMGQELLLSSQRVEPARLAASGYRFLHPELGGALRSVLQKQ